MKKKYSFFIILLTVIAFVCIFAACTPEQVKNDGTSTYTVRFNNNYDNTVTKVEVKSGETVTPAEAPTRAGYIFKGWYLSFEDDATEEFDASQPIIKDLTVFAKWKKDPSKSVITLKYMNLKTFDSVYAVDNGKAFAKPADPEYDENQMYKFVNWYTDAACTEVYDFSLVVNTDITLYAGWSQQKLNIVFDANYTGAPEPQTVAVQIGEKIDRPADPVRDRYEFIGWFTERNGGVEFDFNAPVEARATLYAHWERSEYTLTFNLNGGTLAEGVHTVYSIKRGQSAVETGKNIAANIKMTGHDFIGWYIKAYDPDEDHDVSTEEDIADLSSISEDTTVYAKWTLQTYTVAFDLNYTGAPQAPASQTVKYNKLINEPEIGERDGYMFLGWFKDKALTQQFTFDMPVTESMTLYASWFEKSEEQKHVVITYVYKLSSQTVTVASKQVEFGSTAVGTVPADPEIKDCLFGGWYLDEKFTTPFNVNGTLTQDTTVYGKILQKYTFEAEAVDLTGKSGMGSSTQSFEEQMIYSYTFIGDGTNTGDSFVSNGWFIRELFYNGASITFEIEAAEDIQGAVLYLRVSSDTDQFATIKEKNGKKYSYLSSEEFKIAVNEDFDDLTGPTGWLDYDGLYMPIANLEAPGDLEKGKSPFENCFISANINLQKGYNTITLYVDNNNSHGGTFQAEAPLIDCMYIYAPANLTMFDNEFYLRDNTIKGDM